MRGANVLHPIRVGGLQTPPLPRILPLRPYYQSEAIRVAHTPVTSLRLSPHPDRPSDHPFVGKMREAVSSAIERGDVPGTVNMDEESHKRIVKTLDECDFILWTGEHKAGKSTLAPYLIAKAALCQRDASDPILKNAAKMSPKSAYCFRVLNTGASFRKYHHEFVYKDTGFKLNAYTDPAGTSIRDMMGAREKDILYNANPQKLEDFDGIVTDAVTLIEMLNDGQFGTIVIENGESAHHWDEFYMLLSTAGRAISEGRLGRVIIIASNEESSIKTVKDALQRLSGHKFRIGESLFHRVYGNVYPRPDKFTVNDPHVQTGEPNLPHAHPPLSICNKGWKMSPPSHQPVRDEIVKFLSKKLRLITGFNFFITERYLKYGPAPKSMAEALAIKTPNNEFSKDVLHEVLRAVLVDVTTSSITSAEAAGAKVLRIKDVMVVCAHREQVSEIGQFMVNNPGCWQIGEQRVKGMSTCKISFASKCTSQLYAPKQEDVYLEFDATGAMEESMSVGREGTFKGLVILTTEAIAGSLEVPNLGAVIVTPFRQRPGRYRSNGLLSPIKEWIDGEALNQLISRMGRGNNDPGQFFFAGSALTCDTYMNADVSTDIHLNSMHMSQLLREHCRTELEKEPIRLSTHPMLNTIFEDAVILGYARGGDGTEPPLLDPTISALIRRLPMLNPETAIILIMCYKMGLASHGLAIAAYEASNGRVFQINLGGRRYSNSLHGDNNPLFSVFESIVANAMVHGPNQTDVVPKYDYNEIVCLADVVASLLSMYEFSSKGPERSYNDMKHIARGGRWRGKKNFFDGVSWIKAQIPTDCREGMGDKLRALINPRNNEGLPAERIYAAVIKDEGRECLEYFAKQFHNILAASGVVPHNSQPFDPTLNRYTVSNVSPLLSIKGRRLLSAIVAMSSGLLARWDESYISVPNSCPDKPDVTLPPRYTTGKDGCLLSGYMQRAVKAAQEFAVYMRSDAYVYYPNTERARWHSLLQPMNIAQIAVFMNINGRYEISGLDDEEDTQPTKDEAAQSANSDTQSIQSDTQSTKNEEALVMKLSLASGPDGQQFKINIMDNATARFIKQTRDRLKHLTAEALRNQNIGTTMENFLADVWDTLR